MVTAQDDEGSDRTSASAQELSRHFEHLVVDTLRRLGYDVRTDVEARVGDRHLRPDAVVATGDGPVILELKSSGSPKAMTGAAQQLDVIQRSMTGLAGALIVIPDDVDKSGNDPRVTRIGELPTALRRFGSSPTASGPSVLRRFVPRSVKVEIRFPLISLSTDFELTPAVATLLTNAALVLVIAAAVGVLLQLAGLLDRVIIPLTILGLIMILAGALTALVVRLAPSSALTARILGVVRSVARNVVVYFLAPMAAVVVGELIARNIR